MSENAFVPPLQNLPRRGRGWLRALLVGLLLFLITTIVLFLTGNPNLYPTVILIGNFLVPVVFVAFLYDHQHISALKLDTVATSFCIGGILGIIGASILEALLLPVPSNPDQGMPLTSAFAVGLIEEGCKIVAVMIMARRMTHTSQMDGLLLGGAVGMGFAALESTGYAFTALVSNGHVGASIFSTIIRGLIAPFGHGIWTGILGAVLFRASVPHRFRITGAVIVTYLFVSLLHGLWDGVPLALYFIIPPGIYIPVTTVLISIVGVIVLAVLYRGAMVRQMRQPPLVSP